MASSITLEMTTPSLSITNTPNYGFKLFVEETIVNYKRIISYKLFVKDGVKEYGWGNGSYMLLTVGETRLLRISLDGLHVYGNATNDYVEILSGSFDGKPNSEYLSMNIIKYNISCEMTILGNNGIDSIVGSIPMNVSTNYIIGSPLGNKIFVKDNGAWREANIFVKQSGEWKQGLPKVKQNDSWQ